MVLIVIVIVLISLLLLRGGQALDFLRNFDPDTSDYARRIRFVPNSELDLMKKTVINFGELRLPLPEKEGSPCPGGLLAVPSSAAGNALMRSQSDHRLAAQFAKSERAR